MNVYRAQDMRSARASRGFWERGHDVARGVATRTVFRLLVACAVVMFLPSMAWGFWPPSPISLGHDQTATYALGYTDARLAGGERTKRFEIPVRAGDRLTITVYSPGFSPYLRLRSAHVHRDVGGEFGVHRTVLHYRVWRDDTLTLDVSTARRGRVGVFRMQFTREGKGQGSHPHDHRVDAELVDGSRVYGEIRNDSPRRKSGIYVGRYLYRGKAGERVTIRASSPSFVPLLAIYGHNLAVHSGESLGGQNRVELDAVLPDDGRYVVHVLADASVRHADYLLRLRAHAAAGGDAPAVGRLVVNTTVEGALGPGDLNRRQGQWVDRYRLHLEAGTWMNLFLHSTDFDAYLRVKFPNQGGEESNDISRTNRDASVQFRAPVTGDYRISATSYRRGESGAYVLRVQSGGEGAEADFTPRSPPSSSLRHLQSGVRTRGQLTRGGPTMKDGSLYAAYSLRVHRGEQWTVETRSQAITTHLEVRGEDGFARSSDGSTAQDGNARSTFVAPRDETLILYATSHRPGVTGAFTVRAYRGAPESAPEDTNNAGRIVALLVGISQYGRAEIPNLPYCASDAVHVRHALDDTGMMAPESVVLVNAAATREGLKKAFEHVADAVGPNDVFLFFYSGHGSQLPSTDPKEIDGLDETLVLRDGEVRDTYLGQLINAVNSRLTIVVLDACYSGGFRNEVLRRKNEIGIFSSEEDVASLVAGEFKAGGYLAHILAEALGSDADQYPRDGRVTVDEFLQYIRKKWSQFGEIYALDSSNEFTHQQLVIDRGITSPQETVLWNPPDQR